MIYNEIAKIIAVVSFFGMVAIVFKKIPILVSLPETFEKREKRNFLFILLGKLKSINPFKKFSFENFLQKFVFKIRLLSLKTDTKTFQILQNLKKKAFERKKRLDDNYWEEIKKKMKR